VTATRVATIVTAMMTNAVVQAALAAKPLVPPPTERPGAAGELLGIHGTARASGRPRPRFASETPFCVGQPA
jgi:hypothetical protein